MSDRLILHTPILEALSFPDSIYRFTERVLTRRIAATSSMVKSFSFGLADIMRIVYQNILLLCGKNGKSCHKGIYSDYLSTSPIDGPEVDQLK